MRSLVKSGSRNGSGVVFEACGACVPLVICISGLAFFDFILTGAFLGDLTCL